MTPSPDTRTFTDEDLKRLKDYEDEWPTGSDDRTVVIPTFRLVALLHRLECAEKLVPGMMQCIDIADRLKLPDWVIDDAKEIMEAWLKSKGEAGK